MLKALAIKELRESAGLIALAVLVIFFHLSSLTDSNSWYPFVGQQHLFFQGFFVGLLAMALGLKQTAFEIHQGTFKYLLHRPISRRTVFVVKLLVGGAAILAVGACFILLYGRWAATPGNHPSPFFWSMTWPSWKLLISLLLIYLGSFLCGLRTARWFGSRLTPLVIAVLSVIVVNVNANLWWWHSLIIGLGTAIALLLAIFYYVDHSDQ